MFTPIGAVIGNAVGAVVGTVAQGIGTALGTAFTGVGNFFGAQTGSFIGSAFANVGSAITSAGTWVGNQLGTFFKGDNQFSFGNSWNKALGKTLEAGKWVGGFSPAGFAIVGARNMLIGSTVTNTLQEFGVNSDISQFGSAVITGGLTGAMDGNAGWFNGTTALQGGIGAASYELGEHIAGEDNLWAAAGVGMLAESTFAGFAPYNGGRSQKHK